MNDRPLARGRTRLPGSGGRALLLLLTLIVLACQPAPPSPPTPTPVSVLGAAERKVDSILLDLLLNYQLRGAEGAEDYARNRGLLTRDNHVRVTLVLHGADDVASVRERVQGMGARVTGTWENHVDVRVPLQTLLSYANDRTQANFLRDLADLTAVRDIQEMTDPDTRGGRADCAARFRTFQPSRAPRTEGAERIGAPDWHRAGLTGRGVKVGIIDGGFAGHRALLGSQLPASVVTRAFTSEGDRFEFDENNQSERHGTAVAEVIHAVAPDAELYLAYINGNVTNFGRAVDWLVDEARVGVISMSLGWDGLGPGDGSGYFAEIVDRTRARGVVFVIAAGNEADYYYTAQSTIRNGLHEFAPGKDRLEVRAGRTGLRVVLNWLDWKDRDTDFHLLVLDRNGQEVATSRNEGKDKLPIQVVNLPNVDAGDLFSVRIRAVRAPRPVQLRLWATRGDLETVTPATSIGNPADAKGALTVGATYWRDDQLLCYSSRGPTLDQRVKPDVSAPTHVSTVSYRGDEHGFTGTSASAPHVAGAAALVLGANPGAAPDQVAEFLKLGAKRLAADAPSSQTGHGLVQLGDPRQATRLPPAGSVAAATTPTGGQTATPAAAGTSTPTTTSPSFADDFARAGSGLPDAEETRYTNGRYHIAPRANDRVAWAVYDGDYTSFVAELKGARAEGSGRVLYGLVFWHESDDAYYAVALSSDGAWMFGQWVGDRWNSIDAWTRHAAVRRGAESNDLRVEFDGPRYKVFVNETQVMADELRLAHGGRIGLLAGRFDGSGAASFDELRVTRR